MAGLLLGDYNILVLDEPGNHLDVETVDALAEALLKYQGTDVFTSHERHFLGRIATFIVEVGGGTAKSYLGDYDSYMYMLNRESQGEEQGGKPAKSGKSSGDGGGRKSNDRDLQKRQRKLRREIQNLEKKIADLDRDKQLLNKQLVETTDADEALKVHTKFTEVSDSLARAEDRWLELTEAL